MERNPPPIFTPPEEGPADSPHSHEVTLVVRVGTQSTLLKAWCRVGVWTTLQEVRARKFVAREAWGKLGARPPRRLLRVEDETLDGVVARLRPEEDGSMSFVVELAETEMKPGRNVDIYHGQRVALGNPERRGYRFGGRAPAGWTGAVARWGSDIVVYAGVAPSDEPPPRALAFAAQGEEGFVAGPSPVAEAFVERWKPAEPFRLDADGVERIDYRLVKHRSAAGFSTDDTGVPRGYGPDFTFRRDG